MTVACPKCETPAIIPARERNRAEEIPPGHNVACAACGESWTATPDDLVVVECAQADWDLECAREDVAELPEWMREAAARANWGNRCGSIEHGDHAWVTNGHVCLRTRTGDTFDALRLPDSVALRLDDWLRSTPAERRFSERRFDVYDKPCWRLGRVWIAERYRHLVDTLYSGSTWRAHTTQSQPAHAVVDGDVIALVMPLETRTVSPHEEVRDE